MKTIVLLLILLQFKHLIIDWILQPPWMWKNKGTYGHYGGIIHAAFNASTTALCFLLVTQSYVLVFAVDFLVHYHIDFVKMNITRVTKWTATTHAEFWWLTGLDQFLHQATYIGILYLFVS